MQRTLPTVGVCPDRAARRVGMMRDAFGAEAIVDGFDTLVGQMTCDPKDRHVLAAAARGHADAVVTFNLVDFPEESAAPYGIEIQHPDTFLVTLLDAEPDTVLATLAREIRSFRDPPRALEEFLSALRTTVPTFAKQAAATR